MNRFLFERKPAALLRGLMVALMLGAPGARSDESLDALKREVDGLRAKVDQLERVNAAPASSSRLRLIDTSVDVLIVAGASTEDNGVIEELQAGGHDPKRRGFTLQQAELSFAGVVDPYFTGEAHLVLLEDEIELEEAFITSTSLPAGLQVEAGYFLTEFGRLNPTHPHTWKWVDQPVINGRLLGADGLRAAGVRLGWLTPLPWYSQFHFGIQNADNETAVSFLGEGHEHGEEEVVEGEEEGGEEHAHEFEETVGGRPKVDRDTDGLDDFIYLARWENSFDASDEITALFGLSSLYGPNATGEDGETFIYGADLTMKWKPANNQHGWPFVTWETEVMKRDFEADAVSIAHEDHFDDFASDTIEDWGLYSQVVWGFTPNWETGLRFDYATGNDAGLEERDEDPARSDRIRISPMIARRLSEFSRVRVQYNYDDADFLEDGEAHSVWVGFEALYGAHPAHKY